MGGSFFFVRMEIPIPGENVDFNKKKNHHVRVLAILKNLSTIYGFLRIIIIKISEVIMGDSGELEFIRLLF